MKPGTTRPPLITDLTREDLKKHMIKNGFPAYRTQQIWQWLYRKQVSSLTAMGNVPKDIRDSLKRDFAGFPSLSVAKKQVSKTDVTEKFLFRLIDGYSIESVLIKAPSRSTVCISTQVGCAAGCIFCASARGGFKRNLSAGEIVEQVLLVMRHIPKAHPVDNIVYMGIGEPLLNYDNVIKSIAIINDASGLDIGARKITISTCGIIPGIRDLTKESLQTRLSVSIHTPSNSRRSNLMPINKKYSLPKLVNELKKYCESTRRQITLEYILIKNFNDSAEDARTLAKLFKNIPCSFNIIACNPAGKNLFKPPDLKRQHQFVHSLKRLGFRATLRQKKGVDIDAACGQLRAKHAGKK